MKFGGKKLKWIGGLVGVVVASLILVRLYVVWRNGTELERRLEALRAAGEPVKLSDLARAPIPADENAHEFLRSAATDLESIHRTLAQWYPEMIYPTGPMTDSEQDRMEALFSGRPELLPLLEKAAACPDYDTQLNFKQPPSLLLAAFMDQVLRHRDVTRVLRAHSALRLAQGRNDEALADEVLTLRLTRHWSRDPLLIGYLVTTACEAVAIDGANRVLQTGSVSPAARQKLDAELALHDTLEGARGAMRTELAYSLSSVAEMPDSSFCRIMGFDELLTLRYLDLYDRHVANLARSRSELNTGKFSTLSPKNVFNIYERLVDLQDPTLEGVRTAADRVRAVSRSLRVLNALQARVGTASDQVPRLDELGLPATALLDPFNDEPLHVAKRPEGWMVYSVGLNGVDDGGSLDLGSDVGVGPIVSAAKNEADSGEEESPMLEGEDESEPAIVPKRSEGASPPAPSRSAGVD